MAGTDARRRRDPHATLAWRERFKPKLAAARDPLLRDRKTRAQEITADLVVNDGFARIPANTPCYRTGPDHNDGYVAESVVGPRKTKSFLKSVWLGRLDRPALGFDPEKRRVRGFVDGDAKEPIFAGDGGVDAEDGHVRAEHLAQSDGHTSQRLTLAIYHPARDRGWCVLRKNNLDGFRYGVFVNGDISDQPSFGDRAQSRRWSNGSYRPARRNDRVAGRRRSPARRESSICRPHPIWRIQLERPIGARCATGDVQVGKKPAIPSPASIAREANDASIIYRASHGVDDPAAEGQRLSGLECDVEIEFLAGSRP